MRTAYMIADSQNALHTKGRVKNIGRQRYSVHTTSSICLWRGSWLDDANVCRHDIRRPDLGKQTKNILKWSKHSATRQGLRRAMMSPCMLNSLHDALLSVKMNVPSRPSLINYFSALRLQFGDAASGSLPQAHQSHTKQIHPDILRNLAKSGIKLGDKIPD
jgi:hypothetical protein